MAWFQHGTVRIYYEEEGGGEPVLVIPGWSLSIEDMAPLRQALAQRYRVIAADAPGSGRSQPQPRKYTAAYYEEDAGALLSLLDKLGAKPARIVGFSDGGEYGLMMAALEPGSVRALVTWGSAGHITDSPPGVVEWFGKVVDEPPPGLEDYANYLKATYGEDNARAMAESVTRAWGEIIAAGGNVSYGRAGEIACNALLICGENDTFTITPGMVREMADAMQGGEFIEARRAGHAVHHESPDWLVKTVVDWLADH